MKIEHIAIWVTDLDASKGFYCTYFKAIAGKKYHNPAKNFTSYFLSFNGQVRLELMHRPDMPSRSTEEQLGIAHFAISVGSKEEVDRLTDHLAKEGVTILDGPRTTGDGYYESVVFDPDGNRIEITI